MSLRIHEFSDSDIGAWVLYKAYQNAQKGRVKSFNYRWVFVVYSCDGDWDNYTNYTAEATNPTDLFFTGPLTNREIATQKRLKGDDIEIYKQRSKT